MAGGFFEKLGVEILIHTYEHVYLTLISLVIAATAAVPLGIQLARTKHRRIASSVIAAVNAVQTVPSLALLALIVAVFVLINRIIGGPEWYLSGGVLPTIGVLPAIVALVLYALLPILRNTYTGMRQVDASVREVAQGMGMTPRQVLTRVELPLALPVIMAGLRISMVWTIGIATLCGLVGAGGLGDLIMIGLRSNRLDYLVAGTLPAAVLALAFDALMGFAERWLTPPALREARKA
jgi:osmoprotectant transport system permease protein